MRTEEALRAALEARADLAPDPAVVLATARRRAVRRRRRTTGVGAVVAVALVGAVPVAIGLGTSTRGITGVAGPSSVASPSTGPSSGGSPSASAAPALTGARLPFSFTIAPSFAAGFHILPTGVNADGEMAQVRAVGAAEPQAVLSAFPPGSEDGRPEPPDTGRPVDVNGSAGRVWTGTDVTGIRWDYAPGAKAVIISERPSGLSEDALVAVARGVRFTAPYQVKVPYKLSYLPPATRPYNIVQQSAPGFALASTVQLDSGDGSLTIAVVDGPAAARKNWHPNRTIAGHRAQCTDLTDGRRCVLDFGEFTVDFGDGSLQQTEVERIVAGMTFATWRQPSTWYDVSTALPSS
jgi:hypothetical protein